jgi:hypothetical protein
MTRAKKIVLSVVVALIVAGVLALSVGIWWARSLYHSEQTDAASADAAFAEVRARFGNMRPAFEIQGDRLTRTREPGAVSAPVVPESAHLLVWRPRERTLSRLRVPRWFSNVATEPIPLEALTGVGARGIGALGEAQRRGNDLDFRLGDLERYGRTLLLDGVTPDGTHVVMWSE